MLGPDPKMLVNGQSYRSVWMEDGLVKMIDQRLLPHAFEILSLRTYQETAEAIRSMAVRGAGAIGVAAGYAMAQAALAAPEAGFSQAIEQAAAALRATRPTAHDLFFAVGKVCGAARNAASPAFSRQAAVQLASQLAEENAKAGEQIGFYGARLLRNHIRILTHCNTGWLAFADWGSALAPIYHAHRLGAAVFVYVDETRPRSQGAKLTAWELGQESIPHAIIADAAAGSLFQRGEIDCVMVGADRIAANGDTANKIGTYILAVLADRHQIPFYVAAPRSTFDPTTPDGSKITIEERDEEEVLYVSGLTEQGTIGRVRIAPAGSPAKNPAFDVTPVALITGFITEAGVIEPNAKAIARFLQARKIAGVA